MRIPSITPFSLLLFALLLLLCICNAPVFVDPDTAWHIAAGDLIRAQHGIPLRDSWSFTTRGERWYNISWLFDVGVSFLFQAGGFSALYALTLLVFAGAIAMMGCYCLKRGASPAAILIISIITLFVVYVGVLARPNMCSILLTLLFYQFLHSYRQTGLKRYLFPLPPLMALWVNLHGGFLLAFPLIGFFLLEALISRKRKDSRAYAFTIACCLAAVPLNPYGFSIYYATYRTLTGSFDANLLEWLPVKIGHHIAMTLLLLVALWTGNATDKRIALVDRMLAVALLLLGLSSIRHTIVVALLLMPYLSLRLSTLLYASRYASRVQSFDIGFARDMQQKDIRIMAIGFALLAMFFVTSPYPRDIVLAQPIGFSKKNYPIEEASYIETHYPELRILNHYDMGGYLDYLWRGKVKLFVDGRASSLYSEDLLRDYTDFMEDAGNSGRASVIAGYYHIDGVLISNDARSFGRWQFSPGWKAVYRGPIATLFLRKDLAMKDKKP